MGLVWPRRNDPNARDFADQQIQMAKNALEAMSAGCALLEIRTDSLGIGIYPWSITHMLQGYDCGACGGHTVKPTPELQLQC